eukprot:gene3849-15147_t
MEDFLQVDKLVDQSEDIPRFDANGGKRKRDDEVAEKVQAQECNVMQPEKKMKPSVSDNARTIKTNEIPFNESSYVAGWAENQAKFPSKRKDPSRSSINILRLVKRSDNYYTCEIINTTGAAKKQPTRDHSKDSCLGQNLAANSLSKNRNCSAQAACLDKVEQVKVEVVQEATKSSLARVSQLKRKSTPCPITQITCDNFDRPNFNEVVPGPKECQDPEPALTNKDYAEENEETPGWSSGRSVGYFGECFNEEDAENEIPDKRATKTSPRINTATLQYESDDESGKWR